MVQVRDLTELTLEERWSAVKGDEEWWDEVISDNYFCL